MCRVLLCMESWKEFGKKLPWPNEGTALAFARNN